MARAFAAPLAAAVSVALALALAPAARAQDSAEIEKLNREAEAIQKIVEDIRGLKFKAPVKKGIQSRDELRKFVLEELAKEMPDDKIKALERAYVKLGFLKPGTDLKKILLDLYTEQIAGFYNPERKELFLITHGGPEQNMLMAHELMHALQDQHFDLLPLQKSIVDNDDRSLALTSVIEGEATVVMVAYILKEQGLPLDVRVLPDIGKMMQMGNQFGDALGGAQPGQEVMKNAPKVLTENLLFGYMQGASFCQRMVKRKEGWNAVSGLFADLPQSSEQILHPEKFTGPERDEPIEVLMPDLSGELGAGWKLLTKNVMGEFNTALLFKEKLAGGRADRAGAGWGGDAWQALEGPEGEVVIAWYSVWDTTDDAEEFASTYRDFAEKRGDGGRLEVEVRGRAVVVVDGFRDFAVVEKVRGAIEQKLEERRGYGGAAAAAAPAGAKEEDGNPFASLALPAGWKVSKPDEAAIVFAAGAPGGDVRIEVLDTPAGYKSAVAAATRGFGRAPTAKAEAVPIRGKLGAHAARASEGRIDMRWYVVEGGRQYVLRIVGPEEAVGEAKEAVAKANPGLFGEGKTTAKKKEPALF